MTETARVEFAGRGISFTCVMPSFTATDLIAGTKGTRLVPTVEPADIAAAIARAAYASRIAPPTKSEPAPPVSSDTTVA